MKSFTTLLSLFTTYTQNTTTANQTLGAQLLNDAHRYLLQKYFNNQISYEIPTAGAQTLTLTGTLLINAISGTLSSAWTGNSTKIQITFDNGDIRTGSFTKGSTALTWDVPLSAATTTTSIDIGAQQFYPLPPNYSKLKTLTITVGDLKWTPTEILTRREWDQLNVFPYYSDIPVNFYIFPGGDKGGQIGIWPIPATTGNIITFSYKFRVPDLSIIDTTGNASITTKTNEITSTSLVPTVNNALESRWIKFPQPDGDNLWYQIAKIESATKAILYGAYQGNTISSKTYNIGQMPLLNEDFHDLLVYWAVMRYFSSIVPDKLKFEQFKSFYESGIQLLEEYCGTNTIDVNLGRRPQNINPNLFWQG